MEANISDDPGDDPGVRQRARDVPADTPPAMGGGQLLPAGDGGGDAGHGGFSHASCVP